VFFKNYTYFTLPCRGLGLVGLALYLVHWPTMSFSALTLLVGSPPVKIVSDMTYNVFGRTLVWWDAKPYSTLLYSASGPWPWPRPLWGYFVTHEIGLSKIYMVPNLEFLASPVSKIRHRCSAMAGCATGCAVPKLTCGAHNLKITPVHCNLLTYGHLTSEVYHGVLFYNVNMFTKFYFSSFTSFDVYTMC